MISLEIFFTAAIVILTTAVIILAVRCGYILSELEDIWLQLAKLQSKSKCPNLSEIYTKISLAVDDKIKNLSSIVEEIRGGMKK